MQANPTEPAGAAHEVLLFYRYITIDSPQTLADRVRELAQSHHLTGRVIIAEEGINATLEGLDHETEAFVRSFTQDARFADIDIKRSLGTGASFPGLSVKIRSEIVSTGLSREEADPRVRTAPKLSAEELRQWYESSRDFVVVDMRNNYEFASGRFANSVEAGISASRHLPLVIDKLKPLKNKTIVTVCTGGIRCEKMSAYLEYQGFQNVYQLDGGIHGYMQKYPGKDFLGTLYTFDERITMDFGGDRSIVGTCRLCGERSEHYVNCTNQTCHFHFIACGACTENGSAYCSDACRS